MAEVPTLDELRQQRFLRPTQRQEVEESITQLEDLLRKEGELSLHHGIQINRNDVADCLRRDRSMLEDGTPRDYTGGVKNKLYKTAQALKAEIAYDMPTIDEMERPLPANIDKHIAWERLHKRKILAYRAIMRILDPRNDGPNFASVEAFRTNTQAKGDPRRFSKGYDTIAWDEEQEAAHRGEITDADYLAFLERKVLGWTQMTICKDLQWTKAQFATAMQRFREVALRSGTAGTNGVGEINEETLDETETADTPPSELADVVDDVHAIEAQRHLRRQAEVLVQHHPREWPQEELEKRRLPRNWLAAQIGMERVRLYSLMSPKTTQQWKLEEVVKVLETLATWDGEHSGEEEVGESEET